MRGRLLIDLSALADYLVFKAVRLKSGKAAMADKAVVFQIEEFQP